MQGTPPPPGLDGVHPPPIRQSSIASTCYAAGGMPLAFTQEDFLVSSCFYFVICRRFYLWPIKTLIHGDIFAVKHRFANILVQNV